MNHTLQNNPFVAKTIVTTDLIKRIAKAKNVPCYDVLTGFKWIANLILSKEGKETFLVGGEESYGVLVGDFVRDKDAIVAVAVFCTMTAYYKTQKKTLFTALDNIYKEYGFFYEDLHALTKKGMEGLSEIQTMMRNFRSNPPQILDGKKIITIYDYLAGQRHNLLNDKKEKINLPPSDVLQFILADNSKISVRPSGTEPKIKFYLSITDNYKEYPSYEHARQNAEKKIARILQDLSVYN